MNSPLIKTLLNENRALKYLQFVILFKNSFLKALPALRSGVDHSSLTLLRLISDILMLDPLDLSKSKVVELPLLIGVERPGADFE